MRGVSLMSVEAPEIAQAIYEAGPKRSLKLLAAWMADQTRQGKLQVPNPDEAAEMFSGLVMALTTKLCAPRATQQTWVSY